MKNQRKTLYIYKPLKTLAHFDQLANYMNQKMWFTKLSEFNDPFEAHFFMQRATYNEILDNNEAYKFYFDDFKKNNPLGTEVDFKLSLEGEYNFKCGKVTPIDSWFSDHGAICFTDDPSNIPMWAHYAQNHTGYCVQVEIDFDVLYETHKENCKENNIFGYSYKEFEKSLNKVFHPNPDGSDQEILEFEHPDDPGTPKKNNVFIKVIYKEQKPLMKDVEFAKLREKHGENSYQEKKYLLQNSCGVKFKQWSYENEYRWIVNANSKTCGLMNLISYPFIKITGIIMGHKIGQSMIEETENSVKSENVKKIICCLAEKYNIKLYLAECSVDEYKIKCNEYVNSIE